MAAARDGGSSALISSNARATNASSGVASGPLAPATTSVISPRAKLSSLRAICSSSSRLPRYTLSCILVSSRATQAARSRPKAIARSSRGSTMRCGASKKTSVRASSASVRRRSRRAAGREGRNPSKQNRSTGNPLTARATSTAEGPGTACTAMPASMAARTRRYPGSDTSGVPASLTSTTRAPCRSLATSSSRRAASLCSCSEISGRCTPSCFSRPAVCRVSSAAIKSAAASASRARGDRSPRLPMGVATTSIRPGGITIIPGRYPARSKEARSLPRQPQSMQHDVRTALRRSFTAVPLLALLLLGACATGPVDGTGPASADRAERLQKQGNFTAAAQMYERLAAQNPAPDNLNFALAAAHAWLAGNRPDDAQRTLDAFTAGGTPAQQFERELLRAETATARGQYAAAWRDLAAVAEPANPAAATRLYRLRQDVALRAGQPVEAVRAGMARERLATTDAARNAARRDLLTDLRGAIERGLRIDPAAAREPLIRGWLEVGQIAAAAGRSPLGAEGSLDRWRARFPGHPAATITYSEIVAPAARTTPGATPVAQGSIALLLPLTGSFAGPAELVRDGFLAAISRQPEVGRPAVRVYDTSTLGVGAALQAAQSEGAGFVVGPLTREQAQQAAEQRPGVLPMLLLNNLATDAFPGAQLFQYALAPEDEARQIARQLNAAGQR